jgi:hypothetical protein
MNIAIETTGIETMLIEVSVAMIDKTNSLETLYF